jgi:hypothetical protein
MGEYCCANCAGTGFFCTIKLGMCPLCPSTSGVP